ncbi:MAG TPA: NAD(P)/FAD-dependent oxidoreductase [Ignavibacteria bacterium]|nr:NAD(P)/FAD-dependent oxidoreductase [Ignavibacteria bacterium]HMR41450.1 NAD(P)/FAD-dependent oxidoreductase [Ignavibacteria bacterium]
MLKTDVVIIGGGAAGLMCAAEAGKRGRSVLVIEHEEKIGKKILISGGGRCNFTNRSVSADNFISRNPHFCKSALAGFTPEDFVSLVEKYNISYHEKTLGQLFCDGSSRQIVSMLESECKGSNVRIFLNCSVEEITKKKDFELKTSRGIITSESVVIASGGISIPKMGATDLGYKIAEQFDLALTEIRPGLVPITFSNEERNTFSELSGISIDSIVTFQKTSFRENILFTHKGLSGPAILQISNYCDAGKPFSVDLMPDKKLFDIVTENLKNKPAPRIELTGFISNFFPKRFAEVFCKKFFDIKPLNQYSQKEINFISGKFHNWEIIPSGTEGFDKAEVTLGGIDTNELSSKTMESKKVKNLYFIGEVVDVTGWLGGYNFQWAWASGFAAGQFV